MDKDDTGNEWPADRSINQVVMVHWNDKWDDLEIREIVDKSPEAKSTYVARWKENTLVADWMWVVILE